MNASSASTEYASEIDTGSWTGEVIALRIAADRARALTTRDELRNQLHKDARKDARHHGNDAPAGVRDKDAGLEMSAAQVTHEMPERAAGSPAGDPAEGTARYPRPAASRRLEVVDWLRGLAVVLMIQTHLYDAWVSPIAKASASYQWTRFLGGIPSRLFLLLVGVSMALRFEALLAKGIVDRRTHIAAVRRRGLEVLLLAYLFRIQEYVLGHMGQSVIDFPLYWHDLLRIDILNCIGLSMVLVPYVAAPIRGRPAAAAALIAAAIVLALGPVIGPAHFPRWIPFWLSSYIGGQRPDSWFGLFPWAAWPLVGVALGHLWVRSSVDARRQAWAFAATGLGGFLLIQIVRGIRSVDPQIIRYPSELVQQMGPGSFFYRLGMNGVIAWLGWLVVRVVGSRFSVLRQFGRTSLLVYWIHIDLCYGLIAHRLGLYGRLSMPAATLGFAIMVALMLGVSLADTHWWTPWRRRRHRVRASPPNLPCRSSLDNLNR